jgi:hypothetical protein
MFDSKYYKSNKNDSIIKEIIIFTESNSSIKDLKISHKVSLHMCHLEVLKNHF